MATLSYEMNYAGIPLLLDWARVVRINFEHSEQEDSSQLPPRKHQPLTDLIDEVDRILPFFYLQDICPAPAYPGRNVGALARQWNPTGRPSPFVRINDWWYPFGAQRWSIFRGLATSTMVKEMIKKVQPITGGGTSPKTFTMKCNPISPNNPNNTEANYKLETSMYMLPPRPLAEHGSQFDGLYLITLCDERYFWQYTPISLAVTATSTWADLISSLATTLGVTITYSAIPRVYSSPETDSQLWCNQENAALLLDAVAYSLGRTVVRNLDGTYNLYTPIQSQALVNTNRGIATKVVRTAGGDIFNSGVQRLKVGELGPARDFVVPTAINVAFPRYVQGDPVLGPASVDSPHYLNARYRNPRPTAWYEQSYGNVHSISVPIASVNMQASGGLAVPDDATQPKVAALSGLIGISTHSIHTTAKAIYSGEIQLADANGPRNQSGLNSMALQIAADFYNAQIAASLDEVYPGSFKWTPEGLHEIVWTWSARTKQGTCRVFRGEWNQIIDEMQHAAHSGSTGISVPAGVGGLSVAQTWRGALASGLSGSVTAIFTTLNAAMASGDYTATLADIDNFPTQNRWRGRIRSGQTDEEIALFEGTSGGVSVGIVWRGIDSTVQQPHNNGDSLIVLDPQHAYGVNRITHEKMQFIFQGAWTSGGISEAIVVPQTQTVRVLAKNPETVNTIDFWSGRVEFYDPVVQSGRQFKPQELCWVAERDAKKLTSGHRYDGQIAGHSITVDGSVAPIYLVNESRDTSMVAEVSCCTSWKRSVRLAAIGAVGGTRTGNILQFTGVIEMQTLLAQIDGGFTPVVGNRILLKNEGTAPAGTFESAHVNNGIWEVVEQGVTQATWIRATDFDSDDDVAPSLIVAVEEGFLFRDTEWMLTTNAPIILNSTTLTFAQTLNPARRPWWSRRFSQTATATVTNTTTETELSSTGAGSKTIAANFLTLGTCVLLDCEGRISTGASPPTLRMRISFSATTPTIFDVTFQPPANLSNRVWRIYALFTVRSIGATGTVIGQTWFEYGQSAQDVRLAAEMRNTATITIDTTVSNEVFVQATWGATVTTSESIEMTNFSILAA